ncbi:MAG TPA: hypothetical protein VMT46_04085 [Anaerolineaceae bacterium]|nr:hypothetical protein [Anaerolineaceae bacterium]
MLTNRIAQFAIVSCLVILAACNRLSQATDSQQGRQVANTAGSSAPQVSNSPATPEPSAPPPPPAATPTSEGDMAGIAMEPPSGGGNSVIKISDQPISRGMVIVEDAVVSQPAWIVVYSTKANGQPDQPIGHAALVAGDNKNVMVELDAAKTTDVLYAQIHLDKGRIGVFEYPGPDEPMMVGVQMIASTFKVMNTGPTADKPPVQTGRVPAIIVANQPIKDGKLVIPEVISNGECWLVIHRQNGDGSMGSMVGFAKVEDGTNKNVVVPVDTSQTSTIMYAMLHENNSKLNVPQFPGVDVPVMANGQMIAPTFEITTGGVADVVISLGNKPETTSTLVNGNNMSLYVSLQDTPGRSNCDEDCLKTWRPFLATGRLIAGNGVDGKKLGVILLPNGSRQVTYLGAPLYLFTGDQKPGDVNGQGLDGTWYLVTP